MASINHGVKPAPIGPPSSNSRSSSNASSAASAASAAAAATAVASRFYLPGSIQNNTNGNMNGATTSATNGYSSNSPPNGAAAGTRSPMSMPFGPSIDANGANGVNGTNGTNGANGFNGLACSLQMQTILVRRITIGNNNKAVSHLADFCNQGLIHAEAVDAEHSKDPGYMSAIFKYDTMQHAAVAIDKLNGMCNISFDAKMSAEFLGPDQSPFGPATTTTYTPLPSMLSRAPQGTTLLPQPAGPFTNNAFQMGGGLGSSAIMHEAFSRPNPIGNHLADRGVRTSSLDLINSGSGSDDILDFGRLSLNDNSSLDATPTAISTMAEPPRPQLATQRRSTMPQLKTMQNGSSLRLDTSMIDPANGMQPSGYANPSYARGQAPYSAHPTHPTHSAHPMNSMSAGGLNGNSSFHPHRRGPHHHQPHGRHMVPHVNPSDQHPPCNTLYVGNIPMDAKESELKALFSTQRGYKRLSLRTRNNNTMCFVEFEDITAATKALDELFGRPLSNSNHRGGMRLSYSKNPFGVRSEHNPNNRTSAPSSMHGMNAPMYNSSQTAGAGTIVGAPPPPPGLPVPPNMNPALQHRGDGLLAGNAGSQILPSTYAQVSPWNQPQPAQPMAQQVPQPYGMAYPPSYQAFEDDEDVFTNSSIASVLGSGAGNPLGNYAFQSTGASSAFNASNGYNPAFDANANGPANAIIDGLGSNPFAAVSNGINSGAAASMAYNVDPSGRPYYNGNGASHVAYRPFS